jgi:hypothetical protein
MPATDRWCDLVLPVLSDIRDALGAKHSWSCCLT